MVDAQLWVGLWEKMTRYDLGGLFLRAAAFQEMKTVFEE
jgi:hypothetical protein